MIQDTSSVQAATFQAITPICLALSVIVPTRNEAANVEMLLTCIETALDGTPVEVIFVDDSTDHTPQVVEQAAARFSNLNVRLIHRTPENRTGGLGGAVVTGLRAAMADYAVVMDGDLQHPPDLLPILLKTALEKEADLVVATRRASTSQVTGLNLARDLISKALDLTGRIFFTRELHGVSDPLTGFFLVRVAALNLDALRPKGFKILMEILVRHPRLRKGEVPFHFGERFAGESKASAVEVWKYLNLLLALRFSESTLRFIGFALVGVSGILINTMAMAFSTELMHIHYLVSAVIATFVSTLWNFSLTETLVFHVKKASNGRGRRLAMFMGMNILALVLRGPFIYLMTSLLGIYYILSNLISLATMTLLRFALADNIIWKTTAPKAPTA